MSETKSLAAPKASFDRRAVVKGAAWSVPVIAAAIAAPAAAASTGTQTLTFGGPTPRPEVLPNSVAAPGMFTIKNTGSTIVGSLTFSIVITPVPGAGGLASKMAKIGLSTLAGTQVTGTFDNKHQFTGSVTVLGDLPSSRDFALSYFYTARKQNETEYGSYNIVISLTKPSVSGSSTFTDTKVV